MMIKYFSGLFLRSSVFTRIQSFVICLAVSLSVLACQRPPDKQARTPKAVFIIVDGIAADVIERLKPPVLGEISQQGGYTRAYVGGEKGGFSQTPTISAVGYNSLLTGTWVHKHNVWDNDIADQNYYYPDIFRIAENFKPELKTAIFSTWIDNRTKLVGEGLPQTGNLKLDYRFDGLELDTVRYPHDDNSDYIHNIDEAVADEAARYIRENGPDLSWVYLQYTDDMGHRYGDSEKFYDAVRMADKQVGRIWESIKEREKNTDEDWLIVITTDHGRDAQTGKNHGGQSERERLTWIVTNAEHLNKRFKQTPGIVDIMPSICNHLNIPIPDNVEAEIDAVPFIGPIDFSDLKAYRDGDLIRLSWKDLGDTPDAKAEVFVSGTNNYRNGGKDEYHKVGSVNIKEQTFSFKPDSEGKFVKIVLKGPNHSINTWVRE